MTSPPNAVLPVVLWADLLGHRHLVVSLVTVVTLITEDKHIRREGAAVSPGRMVSPDRSRKTPEIVIGRRFTDEGPY
jgi:hypothetical protein